jgi:hypothetical protein
MYFYNRRTGLPRECPKLGVVEIGVTDGDLVRGRFADSGGSERARQLFGNQLPTQLIELNEALIRRATKPGVF